MASAVMAKNTTARRLLSDSLICPPSRAPDQSSGIGVTEAVADATHREQVFGVLRVTLHLLAQMSDVHVDRARVTVRGVAPDPRQQHVAREHPAWRPGQCREDL